SRPDVLYMQKHWDVMRSDDAGDSWYEVSDNLPTDFGFCIDVNANEPETVYVVPITSDSQHFPPEGQLRVYRSTSGGGDWEPLTKGLPQSNCYVDILRDAMAVDSLDSSGVYFGTTGGQVYVSPDGGDNWEAIVHDLPAVLSVEVQTLA
ncbi:MAG: exo-alpha-sialidase, partial [Acidimicrobiales bacterium]